MAAECDWRRRLFGEQLLRPAPDPGPSLCPVDVLAPPDTHPEVLALYFRALSDCDDCPLTDALKQLYASVSPRLQVSYHHLSTVERRTSLPQIPDPLCAPWTSSRNFQLFCTRGQVISCPPVSRLTDVPTAKCYQTKMVNSFILSPLSGFKL